MKEDLIFDLGMHRGEDTEFYLKKGYRVVGVEADPELAEHCRQRFAARIADGTVTVIEGAIVAKDRVGQGPLRFYKNTTNSVWGTADPQWRDRNVRFGSPSDEIEVHPVDLGAILKEHGVPYYMKIDLEGADRFCLDYLQDGSECPPYLSIEDEKVDLSRLMHDLDVLCALGYRRFRTVQQQTIPNSVYQGTDRFGRTIAHQFEVHASGPFGADLIGWMSRAEVAVEYKWIFEMYKIFGDNSPFNQHGNLKMLRGQLEQYFQRSLPGWYDTHAAL